MARDPVSNEIADASRLRVALVALAVCAIAVTAAPILGAAEAKLPCPCPGEKHHRKKTKGLVGKYKGTTEEGGTVTFRVTGDAKVVGFALTDAVLYCTRGYPEERVDYFPDYKKSATVSHPAPIPMRGVSKKRPQGKEFLLDEPSPDLKARKTGLFKGKTVDMVEQKGQFSIVLPEKGFQGEVEYETADGPTPFPSSQNPIPQWDPNREWCFTKPIDWSAKRQGARGSLPVTWPASG